MTYVSIDIETLGLNPACCDVIEFGAIIDDLVTPIDNLPTFHCYVLPPSRYCEGGYQRFYQGEPFAIAMHADKLKRIANREKGYDYDDPSVVGPAFADWLIKHGYEGGGVKRLESRGELETLHPIKIVVAGKNFANFDAKFLSKLEDWSHCIAYHHRMFDPVTCFFDPKIDKEPPGLEKCLERVGKSTKGYKVTHSALDDAYCVVKVLRHKWGIE